MSPAARRVRRTSSTRLLKLQDKIDQMTTLVKRPTEVRLDESMLEEFKQQVRIAQIQNPA